MKKPYGLVLILALIIISFNGCSKVTNIESRNVSVEKSDVKVNKFPSINDVSVVKIRQQHIGPVFPEEKDVFYFNLDLPEHKKAVADIIDWLNADNVQTRERKAEVVYWKGGYNPTDISIDFKYGASYNIRVEGQYLIINGYKKDKSLVVSGCDDLVGFINSGWESLKQGMRADSK